MRVLHGRFVTTGLLGPLAHIALPRLRALTLGIALAAALAFAPAVARAQTGDANCDEVVDESDLAALISRIFTPWDCGDGDPNLDGVTSASDFPREVALLLETPTPEPTPTSPPALGPVITYFGVAGSGGTLVQPSEIRDDDVAVFDRAAGFGFRVVIEAAPGVTGAAVGQILLNSQPGNPLAVPDLQIQASRDLGNGNTVVCSGGVPAIDPPRFDEDQFTADALNDFACHFSIATTRSATCTLDDFGVAAFASPDSRIQYCFQIPSNMNFGAGETTVTLRIRDKIGNLGPTEQLVIRLPGSAPTSTITRTGTSTHTPTRTPTRTITPTQAATATETRTRTATRTPVPPTSTFTQVGQPTATPTPIQPTATRTNTSVTATFTPTRPTATRTPTSAGGTATSTPVVPTLTRTRTATSGAATATRTPTSGVASPTRTRTATAGGGATPTRTRTMSPTPTPTGSTSGPTITFFGIVRADNRYNPADLIGVNPEGIPIYRRPLGQGFVIVVEGRPQSGRSLGNSSFNSDPGDPVVRPDLQIIVDKPLGDGSLAICDKAPPDLGGVPAVNPPRFDVTQPITDAINDLACRFVDGTGQPLSRPENDACVLFEDGTFGFVGMGSRAQFCSVVIPQAMRFPAGDTLVSARLRDTRGDVGPVSRIIIRVMQQ